MGTSTCCRNWFFFFHVLVSCSHDSGASRKATGCRDAVYGASILLLQRCRGPRSHSEWVSYRSNHLEAHETDGAQNSEGAWKRPRAPSAEAPSDLTYEASVHEKRDHALRPSFMVTCHEARGCSGNGATWMRGGRSFYSTVKLNVHSKSTNTKTQHTKHKPPKRLEEKGIEPLTSRRLPANDLIECVCWTGRDQSLDKMPSARSTPELHPQM